MMYLQNTKCNVKCVEVIVYVDRDHVYRPRPLNPPPPRPPLKPPPPPPRPPPLPPPNPPLPPPRPPRMPPPRPPPLPPLPPPPPRGCPPGRNLCRGNNFAGSMYSIWSFSKDLALTSP